MPPSSPSVSPKPSLPVLISARDEHLLCASDRTLIFDRITKYNTKAFHSQFIERIDLMELSCCDWTLLYLGRLETRGFFSRMVARMALTIQY